MIVVTTPNGQIGHHVVDGLLEADEAVRVIVRNPDDLPEGVRARVEAIAGSHSEAAVIDRACEGADALFWLVPPDPKLTIEQAYIDFSCPAADAIRRYGVKRVVSVTGLGRGTEWETKAGLVTASMRMNDMLMATGVAFRELAMPSFMDNMLAQVPSLKAEGKFVGPISPDLKSPVTATRDMGAAAARLLAADSWGDQSEVPLLGPEDLSQNDLAAIMSEVLGREVAYQQISFEAFGGYLAEIGMSDSFRQGYIDMLRAKNEGMDNVAGKKANSRTATSFRMWCEHELRPKMLR